ncbi:MAG: hypothetical protein ACOCXT_00150 [Candidatus Dojkabacteria bacterium]
MYRLHKFVYGSIAINEPVIFELLDSRPLQQLKHIVQSGAAVYVNPKRDGIRLHDIDWQLRTANISSLSITSLFQGDGGGLSSECAEQEVLRESN